MVKAQLPQELKLTQHAQLRLTERKNNETYYDTKNLMRSSCIWYGKGDLIKECELYQHSIYVCRKSKAFGYMTDGDIEVVYNKNTGVVITVLEVKDKFKPITQYIRPDVLNEIKEKKENKKMRKKAVVNISICPDCGREEPITSSGVCERCRNTMYNCKRKGKEYIPYNQLSEEEKAMFDKRSVANRKHKEENEEELKEIPMPELPVVENYYQMKAESNPATLQVVDRPIIPVVQPPVIDPLSDPDSLIITLRECGCEIPKENLQEILSVLLATDKLKDIFLTIAKSDSQDAILNLEQALNVVERKLQHNWEFNGFREEDDIKFKGFLTWRRVLKGAIFFWKKLYQTNTIIEMQRAWNAYTQDPNEKILLAGDRIDSKQKRYQITTESISTIFNTRRPFTRVFYATSQDEAYNQFVKWMADRQLHENKSKTTIVELSSEGEDGRKEQGA